MLTLRSPGPRAANGPPGSRKRPISSNLAQIARTNRAALLLPVLLGILLVWSRAGFGATDSWAPLTAINVLSLGFAVAALRGRPIEQTSWMWALLGVYLLANFVQGAWFVHKLQTDRPWFEAHRAALRELDLETIGRSYRIITAGFVLLTVCVILLARTRSKPPRSPVIPGPTKNLPVMILAATWVYVMFTAIQLVAGFGSLGTDAARLPFGAEKVTLFYRQEFFPALLVFLMWIRDKRDAPRTRLPLCLLGLALVTETLISTSRGTIFYYGLPLLFLWLVTHRFTKSRRVVVLAGLAVYFFVSPLLTSLRVNRLHGDGTADAPKSVATLVSESSVRTVIRLGGIEQLLLAEPHAQTFTPSTPARFLTRYAPTYFTYDIYDVRAENDFRVAGVMGGGRLLGGTSGVLAYLGLFITFGHLTITWARRHLRTWPVAVALISSQMIIYFSEASAVQMVKTFMSVILIEMVFRSFADDDALTGAKRQHLTSHERKESRTGLR